MKMKNLGALGAAAVMALTMSGCGETKTSHAGSGQIPTTIETGGTGSVAPLTTPPSLAFSSDPQESFPSDGPTAGASSDGGGSDSGYCQAVRTFFEEALKPTSSAAELRRDARDVEAQAPVEHKQFWQYVSSRADQGQRPDIVGGSDSWGETARTVYQEIGARCRR